MGLVPNSAHPTKTADKQYITIWPTCPLDSVVLRTHCNDKGERVTGEKGYPDRYRRKEQMMLTRSYMNGWDGGERRVVNEDNVGLVRCRYDMAKWEGRQTTDYLTSIIQCNIYI